MNIKQLADKLTTELTGTYNYVVSDDNQLFSRDMKLDSESYIPVVLSLVTSFPDTNKYQLTELYQMTFRVSKDLSKDTFYTDIQTFKTAQTDELISSEYVTKTYENMRQIGEDTIDGIDYWLYEMNFTWIYSLAVVGSQSTIKIDTVEIPFIECDITHDIAYINNIAHDTALTNYRMSNDIILLTVPLILSNTAIASVYNYSNTNGYNNIVALDINGVSKSLVIKRTNVKYLKTGQLTVMVITLETAYPRVTFTIDGEVIPNTNWKYDAKYTIMPSARVGANVKGYHNDKTKSWNVTFVKDNSAIYEKIYNDVYGDTLKTEYTLIRDSLDPVTVIIENATEEHTETGDMAIAVRFVEA